jgi:hypothetical protein
LCQATSDRAGQAGHRRPHPDLTEPFGLRLNGRCRRRGADAWTVVDIALAPFAVAGDKATELRPVADDCLAQLATALAAKGVKVARLPGLDEKTLARARPARWAVLGKLEKKKDTISAELRLMEVATGDEMRSYFHTSADPKEIAALGTRAAERIAAFVKEQRSGQPDP